MKMNGWISAAAVVAVFTGAPAYTRTQTTAAPPASPQSNVQSTPQATAPGTQTPSTAPTQAPAGQPASPGTAGTGQTTTQGAGGQMGSAATTSIADTDHGTSILLLDRIQKVLDKVVDRKGTEVTIDRGLLDEIRAEVSQVKASLQGEKR
ncbi:MAG: hypothetical protein JWL71_745 [Acidobacteria bacterium]|nr:hypothetical protein [Acidobacteriota bacterium]